MIEIKIITLFIYIYEYNNIYYYIGFIVVLVNLGNLD